MGYLDYGTWRHKNPIPLLEDNNITVTLQKGGIWSEWLYDEETCCTNSSTILLNVDNSIMYTEVNLCGIIYIPFIEITLENDYIYVLHDLSNK